RLPRRRPHCSNSIAYLDWGSVHGDPLRSRFPTRFWLSLLNASALARREAGKTRMRCERGCVNPALKSKTLRKDRFFVRAKRQPKATGECSRGFSDRNDRDPASLLFLIYCGRLGRLYGPRIDIDYLRPLALCRKTRRAHQLGYGRDRRGIGTRETAGVALGDEQWRSAEFVGILPDLRIGSTLGQ